MADLGWPEIVTLVVLAFALFGWKQLPDISRSVGRSIRVFRSEVASLKNDPAAEATPTAAAPSGPPPRESEHQNHPSQLSP